MSQTGNIPLKIIEGQPLQIFTSDTEPLATPAASVTLTEACATNRNKIMIKTSNKCIFKRKTSAQVIKDNILKCRYNRRVGQLKELTQHNVKMFLRIKAQDSQYKFKTIQNQISCKMLPVKSSRIKSQNHTSTHASSQIQLVKDDLKTRCFSLKRGFAKDFKSINNIANADPLTNACKSTEIGLSRNCHIERKFQTLNNKQNQVQNQPATARPQKCVQGAQLASIENKLVAKKLGLVITSKDFAKLKEKSIVRRKQEIQSKRSVNLFNEGTKNEEVNKEKKKNQGLAERFFFENKCLEI